VTFRSFILACALVGRLAHEAPAPACQYTHAPEPVGDSSAIFLGGRMFDAASFVDLAVAERADRLRGPDGRPLPTAAITFRVLRRLKGDSPDRFFLFGRSLAALDPSAKASDLRHWVDPEGRVYPFTNARELPARGREMMTSCDPPDIEARAGRVYLVFREADGRLLGSLPFHPGQRPAEGYAFADVGLAPDSPWARHVPHPEYRRRPEPDGVPDEAHGLLIFKSPVPAGTAEALARRAGAVPFAVTVMRGASRADYRLGTELAWPGLIGDAVTWASRNRTDSAGLRELARQAVDAWSAYDLGTDTAKREYALDLLGLAEPEPVGQPLVAGFAFRGGAAVRRVLAASQEVAMVQPAVRIRDRLGAPPVASAPPSIPPAADPFAEVLHQRLAALAGREVADAAVAGAWQLADVDGIPIPRDTLRLRLDGGKLSGTLSCSSFAGRYRLVGLTMTFDAPKPSLATCAKRDTDWLGEGFWAEPVATVRSTGAELVLARGNARYRFVRL
jgi:hypothetical protein